MFTAQDNNIGVCNSISMFGHSMIEGTGATGEDRFPALMAKALPGRLIFNEGIGGQKFDQIFARAGSYPCKVIVTGGSITGTTEVVVSITPKLYSDGTSNNNAYSGTINNIPVLLQRVGASDTYKIRSCGPAVTSAISDNSLFIADIGVSSRHHIRLYWAGRNDTAPYTGLIDAHNKDIDLLSSPKRFIVLGNINLTSETIGTSAYNAIQLLNSNFLNEYGDRFVPVTPATIEELTEVGYVAANPETAANDIVDRANGIWYRSIQVDGTHLNAFGQKIIANRVRDKILSLRW